MAMSTISGTHLLLGVGALLFALFLYDILFSPLRHFSGPFIARFTNFYRAKLTLGGNIQDNFREWHRQHGTAVRVGPNAVSIGDPDLIKVIYATKNAWIKSDQYRPNDVIVNGMRISNIFNTPDKNFHAKYSTPIRGFWSMTKILEMEPLMDQTLRETLSVLTSRFADTKKTCMMDEWLTYYAWDAAANVSFGEHYGFLEKGEDVGGMLAESKAGLAYFSSISQIPWLDQWLDKNPIMRIGPRPLVNGFIYTVNLITQYQQQVAGGEVEKKKQEKPAEHFLDKYYGLKETCDFADDNQIINWLMLNVLAGGDSTSGAMRSVAYHLAQYPEAQKKLQKELDEANLSLPAQYNDIKNLPYLNAAILESNRLSPALGLMMERLVPSGGFTLPDGRVIPEGTKVGINPCVVTRDVDTFGTDVDVYRPERWLKQEDESESAFKDRYRRMAEVTDLMYGAGSRICMGKHLAKVEMWKLFATLYSAFNIQLKDPKHEWNYRNSWFLYQSDMPMTITPRGKVKA